VRQLAEVESVTPVIEDDALLTYSDRQYFATIKGIPADYLTIAGMDSSFVTSGKFILESDGVPYAVVGMGVAYYLSVGLNFSEPIHVYAPKKGLKGQPNPANAFIHSTIYASGIFANQQEIDSKYVLVPFAFASELFKMEHKVSAVEVKLREGAAEQKVRAKISDILGNKFVAKTQYEQHEVFYKVMQSEKWAIFLILGFILVIASFNILGSLSMLIIDKKADIAILESMGANRKLIRTIFLFEGWMISIIGAIIGLILGVLICWSQIEFGWLKIPNEGSFIFSSYPVEIRIGDLLSVFGLVTAIGFVAAWYPIRFISGNYLNPESK
jgi:lipoprotein-releasing system permease protein